MRFPFLTLGRILRLLALLTLAVLVGGLMPPQPRWTLPARAWTLGFSGDGKVLVTLTNQLESSSILQRWDVNTGQLLSSYHDKLTSLDQVHVSQDGKIVAFVYPSTASAQLHRLDYRAGEDHPAPLPVSELNEACVSPDFRMAAIHTKRQQNPVELWDLEQRRKIVELESPSFGGKFTPDGKTFVLGYESTRRIEGKEMPGASLRFLDAATGRQLRSIAVDAHASEIDFSPDGHLVIVHCQEGEHESPAYSLRVCEVATGRWVARLPNVCSPCFLEGGAFLMARNVERPEAGLCCWNTKTWQSRSWDFPVTPTRGIGDVGGASHGQVIAFQWSECPDFHPPLQRWLGKQLRIKAWSDPFVKSDLWLFDAQGQTLGHRVFHSRNEISTSLAPDGRSLVVELTEATGHSCLQIWDVPPRKPLRWLLIAWTLLALAFGLIELWCSWRNRRAAASRPKGEPAT